METKRQLQVGELIRRNFSMVLFQEGPYIYGSDALVSVTDVKMSPDLGIAKIYLSIYNTDNKQGVMLHLQQETHRLRQLLAQRTRKQLRRIPEVNLFLDDTLDEMYKLRNLFDRLEKENQMGNIDEEE